MSYSVQTRTFIGKGPVYLQSRNNPVGYFPIGNVSKMALKIGVDTKTLSNYQASGGGNLRRLDRIKDVTGQLSVSDFSPTNLALALRGDTTDVASASVAAEAVTMYPESFVPLTYIPDPSVLPVVTVTGSAWQGTHAYALNAYIIKTGHIYKVTVAGTSSSGEPTWPTNGTTVTDGTVTWKDMGATVLTKDTHYTVGRTGIQMLAAAPVVSGGTSGTVGYTKNAMVFIEAMVNSGDEYTLYFDGLNEDDSDTPMSVRAYKVKFSPTSGLDFIGADYGVLTFDFELLADTSIVTTGLSQFVQIGLPA